MRVLITFLFLILFARAALAEPEIQFRAHVEIKEATVITLGDLAEFRGFEEADVREIKKTVLGDAPGPGEAREFTDAGISQILREHLKRLEQKAKNSQGSEIRVLIPSVVTVKRRPPRLQADDIEIALKRTFAEFCQDCDFTITQLRLPPAPMDIPEGADWSLHSRSGLPRGSFSLPLEIKNADGTRRLLWISGQLQVMRTVPVVRRALSTGEKIQTEDVVYEKRDVSFSTDTPAERTEIPLAYAARAVSANQILWRSLIKREPAARVGQTVKVVLGSPAWQISIDGVAQQGGSIGDVIRVRIPRTKKMLSGTITDKALVEVQ